MWPSTATKAALVCFRGLPWRRFEELAYIYCLGEPRRGVAGMARTGATGAARAPAEEPSRRSMTKVASMGAKKFGDARKRVTYRVKGGVVHIDGAIRAGARIVATSAKRSLGRATWTRPKLVVDWHRRDVHINPPVRSPLAASLKGTGRARARSSSPGTVSSVFRGGSTAKLGLYCRVCEWKCG